MNQPPKTPKQQEEIEIKFVGFSIKVSNPTPTTTYLVKMILVFLLIVLMIFIVFHTLKQ